MTVSRVFEDGRNSRRPYTFTVRANDLVTHHRFHRADDAETARQEFVEAEAADDAGYTIDVLRARAEGYEWS